MTGNSLTSSRLPALRQCRTGIETPPLPPAAPVHPAHGCRTASWPPGAVAGAWGGRCADPGLAARAWARRAPPSRVSGATGSRLRCARSSVPQTRLETEFRDATGAAPRSAGCRGGGRREAGARAGECCPGRPSRSGPEPRRGRGLRFQAGLGDHAPRPPPQLQTPHGSARTPATSCQSSLGPDAKWFVGPVE